MLPWYALHVQSCCESKVTDVLNRSHEAFFPHRKTHDRWNRVARRPWFPGYVFARFDYQDRSSILSTPHVVKIVGVTGQYVIAIPDQEINALQRLAESKTSVMAHPFLRVGEKVRVIKGPLQGIEGRLERFKGGQLLVVSIDLLQRSVATEMNAENIEPCR